MKLLLLISLTTLCASYTLTGPSGRPIIVSSDEDGIISINATVDTDLFFAQGYVFAKDRWWQLEVGRMTVSGTLSTVLGKGALDDDIFFRSLNLLNISQSNFENFSPKVQSIITATTNGINSYYASLTSGSAYPAEYLLYGIDESPPKNWTVAEATASGVKILSFGLANGQGVQSSTGVLVAKGVPAETVLASLQPRPYEPTVMGGLNKSAIMTKKGKKESSKQLPVAHAPLDQRHIPVLEKIQTFGKSIHFPRASNNWVVSGKYTDTGKPILCNDPHLRYQTPSLWQMMRLYSPEYSAVGAALPLGLPGVAIGANADISWGYTNVMSLEQQLFVMQTRTEGDAFQYYYKGSWVDFVETSETFDVKGTPTTIKQLYSVYGPVISEGDGVYISFWWTGLLRNDTAPEAAIMQGYATNHAEWLEAVSKWGSANQNGIFADSNDIAYHATGFLHHRLPGDSGQFPLPGDGSMDFMDRLIPFESLPQMLNPDRGYIFSANNRILELGQSDFVEFPQFDGLISGFRAQRIGEMIQSQIDSSTPITVNFMGSIQGDQTTLFAAWMQPTWSQVDSSSLDELAAGRFDTFQAWDGKLDLSSTTGPMFELFWLICKNATYFELKNNGVFWLDIEFMQTYLQSDKCQNDWGIPCGTYITNAWQRASDMIPEGTTFGSVHNALFSHVTPVGDLLSKVFDRVLPMGGSPDTPFAADGGQTAVAGPSYRQIVSMGDRSSSLWMMPMGNSGDPTSPFYDNLLQRWANVEYIQMNF